MPKIEKEYIETGKVKYVFRDFPIKQLHPNAFKAAEAANCSAEQGKYWEMHARLFANQRALGPDELSGHAEALGLDLSKFQPCLANGKYTAEIRKDIADGGKAGVKGTPTFFIGLTEPNKPTIKVHKVIRGAYPYSRFRAEIESLISSEDK